ncbi:hypothetical protein WDZ92_39970, partial [Nostoc sp. NIES-2111]
MKIAHVLPRNMRFDRACATSIDLCVSELSCASRFADETVVLAEAGSDPLPAPSLVRLSRTAGRASAWRLLELVARLRSLQPELVIVQQ